ncbi:uncharacterized protein LOC116259778 isoform X2 [Nymphaea colorata]|uniref:uncharacterized protein LOC116259778 isoform X2 n=1 Tax=Nymphaea colorata TaxID=210225 RepID=UPI00129DEFB0|nr:uncharacterized protein LOC116259778 isoform X2 [Nymphaea colorata]
MVKKHNWCLQELLYSWLCNFTYASKLEAFNYLARIGDVKTAPSDFCFPTANQTRCLAAKGTLVNVKGLHGIIVLFAQGNGLSDGMNGEKKEHFQQGLFKLQVNHICFQTVISLNRHYLFVYNRH